MTVKRQNYKPRLSAICKSANIRLRDLARASGVSIKAIEKLESSPPIKDNVWETKWHRRILAWLPLLGHAFQDVPNSLALEKCPEHERKRLLDAYQTWATQPQQSHTAPPASAEDIEARRAKFHDAVYEHNNRRDWDGGARLAAQAARLYPKREPNWLFYRALETSCVQYGGQPELADSLITQYLSEYDWSVYQSGCSPDVRSRTYAELVQVWSDFGRGNWQQADTGFRKAMGIGDAFEDNELKNTGTHMLARTYFEPWVLRAIYADYSVRTPSPTLYVQHLNTLYAAQSIVRRDSVEAGFGTWYIGMVTGLTSDHAQGKSLVRRSEGMLLDHKLGIGAKRRCGLALCQADIYGSTWDAQHLRHLESALGELLDGCGEDTTPYTDAQTALSLAHVRLLRDPNTTNPTELQTTLRYLLFALLMLPHPQHTLWQIAMEMLQQRVKPKLSSVARLDTAASLDDYVRRGVWPFTPLPSQLPPQRLTIATIKIICEELRTDP